MFRILYIRCFTFIIDIDILYYAAGSPIFSGCSMRFFGDCWKVANKLIWFVPPQLSQVFKGHLGDCWKVPMAAKAMLLRQSSTIIPWITWGDTVMMLVMVMVMVMMLVMVITVWSFLCWMATMAQVLVITVRRQTGKENLRKEGSNTWWDKKYFTFVVREKNNKLPGLWEMLGQV